ncbi:hypothetical protein [Candidatus Cyanaurora vandensis]|uniref:hypothetical protein n=1 Tax=Candidatus Cyanaurora vandensis TaxID=2714958 RepID=UPI00257DD054|nr:hypothetical protein [Candidatus Cyanaurora vandensis]
MKSWSLLLALLLVGCAQTPAPDATVAAVPATATAPKLAGDDTGTQWQTATLAQKLEFCRASMLSYQASGTSSFSISAKTNSLTPENLCKEMDGYFSGKGTGLQTDRLGHAAGMAVIFAGKPYKADK